MGMRKNNNGRCPSRCDRGKLTDRCTNQCNLQINHHRDFYYDDDDNKIPQTPKKMHDCGKH